jgi:hypothetical protein
MSFIDNWVKKYYGMGNATMPCICEKEDKYVLVVFKSHDLFDTFQGYEMAYGFPTIEDAQNKAEEETDPVKMLGIYKLHKIRPKEHTIIMSSP